MKQFYVRTVSGAAFAAVLLAALFINGCTFGLLVLLIAAGTLFEYCRMPSKTAKTMKAAYYFAGPVYVIASMAFLLLLGFYGGFYNRNFPLSFFLLIWSSDVGAYCTGCSIGKKINSRKLAPAISPNKTWAGFWGGLVLASGVALLLSGTGILPVKALPAVILGMIIHCSGVAGDLLESAWKRYFGVKDSGNLIPGHGGMLDRFDSSLLAIPFGTLFLITTGLI